MFVIIVYDVNQKRVAKLCKFLRRYLSWVQNSVFEGEITESQLERIRLGARKIIDRDEDSIYIYKARSDWNINKEIIGTEKAPTLNVL